MKHLMCDVDVVWLVLVEGAGGGGGYEKCTPEGSVTLLTYAGVA